MKEHAAIIIKNNEGEVLFIKRALDKKTLPGAWSFPSGTVEKGEENHYLVHYNQIKKALLGAE